MRLFSGAERMPSERASFADRRKRAASKLREQDFGALLVSPGADLQYLAGYQLFTSERLTCLVLDRDGKATLVCPAFEAPRAAVSAPDIERMTWGETDDPYAIVASLVPPSGTVGVADQMWAGFFLRFQDALPRRGFRVASLITRSLRMRKDAAEIEALRAVSESADRAYARILERPFAGRTEREIGADLAEMLRAEGHDEVGFTIVGSGANGASPHHEAGDRRIAGGDTVVLDFGGAMRGYRSDITRTVHVGKTAGREEQKVHDVVRRAQEAGYAAARKDASAESVDAAARRVIEEAGFGEFFIHRTGHGIGLDGHEHPYLVRGNRERLEPGMAFSIEPGIYLPGRFGVRIEDVAVIDADGSAQPLNLADHAFATVA
ncbi:MAG TPA: Xaa-Pro peptidase family protein [Candidatus Bathyarchaeia archaeon]|nr:Xaa-Pro peptidase family protein [Candidatus Bathyarchaeia archaeon]